MASYDELIRKLREIFQIDKPDLDFGIYRIINQRAGLIEDYLQNRLREKIAAALTAGGQENLKALESEIREARKTAETLGINPDTAPKVIELKERYSTQSTGAADYENAVFSHLLTFFSRYYDDGDFISQRRYKGDTYAIPYAGEEVVLHWANKDQYYTKSGENFSNFTFRLDDSRAVHFRLLAADTAKDNRNDTDKTRCFRLAEPRTITQTDGDEIESGQTVNPIEEIAPDAPAAAGNPAATQLVLRFEYAPMDKGTKQAALNQEAIAAILDHEIVKTRWPELATRMPTEANPARTLLEKHLATYTASNNADYFIHKDLKGFLTRELDFYIKTEVMHLDDLQAADRFADIEKNLRMIQCLRAIARELIDFLAQIENFQKKLWLKRKFVTETQYCITLDRVPESLFPEIAANDAQRAEWVRLFAIDEIQGDLHTPAYAEPLTVEFLKANDKLVLDTRFFDAAFKAKLLAAIENFDDQCDGLLIHSENFQALNLLQERYREQVKCVYIDPPYNTGQDDFLYKDKFQRSSWLSFMLDRVSAAQCLISDNGLFFSSIDFLEEARLREIVEQVFRTENFLAKIVWEKRFTRSNNAKLFSTLSENILAFRNSNSVTLLREPRNEKADSTYSNPDNDARGPWTSVSYVNPASKKDRPNLVYPLRNPFTERDVHHPTNAWKFEKSTYERHVKDNRLFWGSNGSHTYPRLKKFLSEMDGMVPVELWKHEETGTTDSASKLLVDEFGTKVFEFPKPPSLMHRIFSLSGFGCNKGIFLDFFAGTGPSGHAVINLNREDDGQRKYILVEMGDYFDTVLKPRIQKVIYSKDWKNGKPTARETGVSHCFKYIRLESYEDTLNNIIPKPADDELFGDQLKEDFLLHYMLDVETRDSLLSVADFKKPFDYSLDIAVDSAGATEPRKIDLVETFNYLIGLRVSQIDADLDRGLVRVEGRLPTGEKALVLWRDCDKFDYEALNKLCERLKLNPRDSEYDVIYINGDHNIPAVMQELETEGGVTRELKLRQIEPEFLRRMFEVEDV